MMLQQSFGAQAPCAVHGRTQRPVRVSDVAAVSRRQCVIMAAAQVAADTEKVDGRNVRRSLNQTGRYVRQPKNDEKSQALMEEHGVGYSTSGLVAQMREKDYIWQQGEVTVKLAKAYGYCWGVERAVRMAYEARNAFPDKKVYITNEIIHNPEVNQRLRELDIEIFENSSPDSDKDYGTIKEGDVVIFPAFGATVGEMKTFKDKGVQMVDTTCPWVTKVWNSVDTHSRKAFTSVIHGKYSHEETIATASFADSYIIVKDLKEAEYVCDYVVKGGDKAEFMAKFAKAVSAGFDPDRDLVKVGLANQTTMLKGETQAIGKLLERTMMEKYGPAELNEHFMLMDTICDATQERQDALYEITDDPSINMMIVVGGFNSSNTSHLQEIAEHKNIPSFWVDSAARIDVDNNKLLHKTSWGELKETSSWLPDGPVTIAVTSGASTPDRAVEEVLEKVFKIKDPAFCGVAPKECTPMVTPTH